MFESRQRRWSAALFLLCGAPCSSANQQPHLILYVVDDLGFADVDWRDDVPTDVPTPQIKALSRSSAALGRFYTAPSCSPTRSTLLTGRYTHRTGIYNALPSQTKVCAFESSESTRLQPTELWLHISARY